MHGLSLLLPLDLEIGFWVEEGIVIPWKDFEQAARVDLFTGVFEIFFVIGHEEEFAFGCEGGFDGAEERDLHEAAAVMFEFRPRIRAEEVDA